MKIYIRTDNEGIFAQRAFTEKAFIDYVNSYVEADMGYPDDYENVVNTIHEAIHWAGEDNFEITVLELEE